LLFFKTAFAQDSLVSPKEAQILVSDTAAINLDAFPKNFKKNYQAPEFIYEFKTPEKNAWDRFLEWLAGIFKNLFSFTSDEDAMDAVVIGLKVIAILIVVFVIYLIVKALMNKDGQWIFGKSSDKKLIRYDEIEKNLHLQDFEKLVKNAIETDDKRLAIRYYYLWFLRRLSDRNLIEWDIEKTNSDYLYEIKNPRTKDRFAYLSYLYDYIWYGEFALDETNFEKTKTAFENAIKSVGNE